jgi:hypothetical protein
MQDLKFVKARGGGGAQRQRQRRRAGPGGATCALSARPPPPPAQEENADLLREALACSLKVVETDTTGLDDDGRPLKPEQ